MGQMNCPTFTRYGGYDRIEISPFLTVPETHALVQQVETNALIVGGDFQDRSFALGVTFRYYLLPRVAIRLKLAYMQRTSNDAYAVQDSITNVRIVRDIQYDQLSYKVAPGFQYTFFDEHVSFFGGLELPITVYGDWSQSEYVLSQSLTDTAYTETFNTRLIPGGTAIGIGAFGGVQYYFTRNFAAGLEVSAALQYTSVGGAISFTSVSVGSGSGQTSTVYNQTWSGFGFSPLLPALFITLRF